MGECCLFVVRSTSSGAPGGHLQSVGCSACAVDCLGRVGHFMLCVAISLVCHVPAVTDRLCLYSCWLHTRPQVACAVLPECLQLCPALIIYSLGVRVAVEWPMVWTGRAAWGVGLWPSWAGWRGVGPSQCSIPQARPLMRVSPGGVFPVHASAKPYSDCLVSLRSSTNRAIPVGSAFGRIGLQLFSCSSSTETVNFLVIGNRLK